MKPAAQRLAAAELPDICEAFILAQGKTQLQDGLERPPYVEAKTE